MKRVTVDKFPAIMPGGIEERIRKIAGDKEEWTALEVLALEDVPPKDRLWAVLREEFIPARTLHEFACVVAEEALAEVENPDPRSVAALAAKRKWLRGEISDKELQMAYFAAGSAQHHPYSEYTVLAEQTARGAARIDARDAAYEAAQTAIFATIRRTCGWYASEKASDKIYNATWRRWIKMLSGLLHCDEKRQNLKCGV
jgi:hypothetical protein